MCEGCAERTHSIEVFRHHSLLKGPGVRCMFSHLSNCNQYAQYTCKACPGIQACESCLGIHHETRPSHQNQVYVFTVDAMYPQKFRHKMQVDVAAPIEFPQQQDVVDSRSSNEIQQAHQEEPASKLTVNPTLKSNEEPQRGNPSDQAVNQSKKDGSTVSNTNGEPQSARNISGSKSAYPYPGEVQEARFQLLPLYRNTDELHTSLKRGLGHEGTDIPQVPKERDNIRVRSLELNEGGVSFGPISWTDEDEHQMLNVLLAPTPSVSPKQNRHHQTPPTVLENTSQPRQPLPSLKVQPTQSIPPLVSTQTPIPVARNIPNLFQNPSIAPGDPKGMAHSRLLLKKQKEQEQKERSASKQAEAKRARQEKPSPSSNKKTKSLAT